MLETALDAEMTEHRGYVKHDPVGRGSGNCRNGTRAKTVLTEIATITIDHSDNKQDAAATWKRTWGHHPLLVFLDLPEIAGGEALAGLLRPGNAGSNTAADHVTVLCWALDSLPTPYRPDPHHPGAQSI